MPNPPAAFSPLMITQSSRQRSRRAGRRSLTALRPGRPTMSPRKSRRMAMSAPWDANELGFGDDRVEPAVMRLERNLDDLLNRIGEPNRENRVLFGECRDRAVEMALAVSDAPTPPVEACER